MRRREFFALSALAGVFAGIQPAAKAFQIPDPAQPARLRLAAACADGAVYLWEVASGSLLARVAAAIQAESGPSSASGT